MKGHHILTILFILSKTIRNPQCILPTDSYFNTSNGT
jgi:hypothetical protein